MSCAIDFGTSISAIAIPDHTSSGMRLVPLKGQHRTVPTAISYVVDRHERGGPPRAFGRAGAGVVGQVCAASGRKRVEAADDEGRRDQRGGG
jgi:molecular chaperone DnaK (HSP70)